MKKRSAGALGTLLITLGGLTALAFYLQPTTPVSNVLQAASVHPGMLSESVDVYYAFSEGAHTYHGTLFVPRCTQTKESVSFTPSNEFTIIISLSEGPCTREDPDISAALFSVALSSTNESEPVLRGVTLNGAIIAHTLIRH